MGVNVATVFSGVHALNSHCLCYSSGPPGGMPPFHPGMMPPGMGMPPLQQPPYQQPPPQHGLVSIWKTVYRIIREFVGMGGCFSNV